MERTIPLVKSVTPGNDATAQTNANGTAQGLFGGPKESAWNNTFSAYENAHPELAAEFTRRINGEMPADWENKANQFIHRTYRKGWEVEGL